MHTEYEDPFAVSGLFGSPVVTVDETHVFCEPQLTHS